MKTFPIVYLVQERCFRGILIIFYILAVVLGAPTKSSTFLLCNLFWMFLIIHLRIMRFWLRKTSYSEHQNTIEDQMVKTEKCNVSYCWK